MKRAIARLAADTVGVSVAVVLFLAAGVPAYAAPAPGVSDIEKVLNNATGWLMAILAAVATFFLTVGGVRYLMAGGDPSEVEKAKGAFKSAGIGFALAALAPIVVGILKGILGVP